MSNFIKTTRDGELVRARRPPPLAAGKSPFCAAAAGEKNRRTLRVISRWPGFVRQKKAPFLKGFRPRVSKRDSTIALHALSCGLKGRPMKERRERRTGDGDGGRETGVGWTENQKGKKTTTGRLVCSVSPRCIAAVVHIRANRKIDKKRRFVKCRGRLSLLAAAGIELRAAAPGGGNDTVILGSYHCSGYLSGPLCSQPFRRHQLGIGDTNAAYLYWILRLCLAHNGFCFERNFVGRWQLVCLAHYRCCRSEVVYAYVPLKYFR